MPRTKASRIADASQPPTTPRRSSRNLSNGVPVRRRHRHRYQNRNQQGPQPPQPPAGPERTQPAPEVINLSDDEEYNSMDNLDEIPEDDDEQVNEDDVEDKEEGNDQNEVNGDDNEADEDDENDEEMSEEVSEEVSEDISDEVVDVEDGESQEGESQEGESQEGESLDGGSQEVVDDDHDDDDSVEFLEEIERRDEEHEDEQNGDLEAEQNGNNDNEGNVVPANADEQQMLAPEAETEKEQVASSCAATEKATDATKVDPMDTTEGTSVTLPRTGEESLQESFSALTVNANATNGIEEKDKTNDDKDKADDDKTAQATTTSKNKKRRRKKKKNKKKSALSYKAGTSGNIQYKMSEVFREDSHSGAIYCVTFNNVSAEKNGQELMATCGDQVATVYMRVNGELIPHSTYRDDADVYHTCCWSVDQRTQRQILIFAGHRGHIHMVDVGLQVYIKTYRSHALAVNDLKVAPLDPTYLLSASNDHSIRLWNTWNDVLIAKFGGADGHIGEVLSIDFHPIEWYFVSCGVDRSIRVWSLARGTILEAMDEAKLIQPGSPKKYQFRTRHEQVPAFATRQIHENIIDCVAWIKDWIITRSSMEEIAIFRPGKRLTTQTTQLRHHFKSLKYNSSDTSTDTEIWRGMMAKDRDDDRDRRRKNGEKVTTTDSSSGSEDEIIDFKLPPLYEVDRIRLSHMSCWFLRFQMDKRRSFLGVGNMIGQLLLWDLTLKDAFDVPPIIIPAHPYTRDKIVRQVAFNRDGSRMAAVTDKCMVIVYELTRITPPDEANSIGETEEQPLDPMVCGEVDVTGKPVKKMWLHPDFIPEHFTQEDIDRVFWGRAYDLSHRDKYFMGMGGEKVVLHHKPIARSSKNRPETKKQTKEPKPKPTKKYSTRGNRADVGSDSSSDESENSDASNDSAKSRNSASSSVEPASSAEPNSLEEKSPSVDPSSSGEPNPSTEQIQLQMPGTSGENLISPSTSTAQNGVSITEGDTEPTNSAFESNDGVPSPSSETNEGTDQMPEENEDPMDVDGDREEEEVIEVVESPEVVILDDDDDEDGVEQEVEDEDDDIQEIPIPTPEPNANMEQDAELERLEQDIERKKQELKQKKQQKLLEEQQEQIEAQKKQQQQIEAQKKQQQQIEAQKKQKQQIEAQKKQKQQIEAQQHAEQIRQQHKLEQVIKVKQEFEPNRQQQTNVPVGKQSTENLALKMEMLMSKLPPSARQDLNNKNAKLKSVTGQQQQPPQQQQLALQIGTPNVSDLVSSHAKTLQTNAAQLMAKPGPTLGSIINPQHHKSQGPRVIPIQTIVTPNAEGGLSSTTYIVRDLPGQSIGTAAPGSSGLTGNVQSGFPLGSALNPINLESPPTAQPEPVYLPLPPASPNKSSHPIQGSSSSQQAYGAPVCGVSRSQTIRKPPKDAIRGTIVLNSPNSGQARVVASAAAAATAVPTASISGASQIPSGASLSSINTGSKEPKLLLSGGIALPVTFNNPPPGVGMTGGRQVRYMGGTPTAGTEIIPNSSGVVVQNVAEAQQRALQRQQQQQQPRQRPPQPQNPAEGPVRQYNTINLGNIRNKRP